MDMLLGLDMLKRHLVSLCEVKAHYGAVVVAQR